MKERKKERRNEKHIKEERTRRAHLPRVRTLNRHHARALHAIQLTHSAVLSH